VFPDWAESYGVPRHLLRLSVGLEDPDDLWKRIERALAVVDR
jgi:cystathionine gamma-synthase